MFRSSLGKISTNLTVRKCFLRPMPFIRPSHVNSSNSNETVANWISSLPEDKQKRVKLIQNEIALKLAEMSKMPQLEMLTKADYEEMLEMSSNRRQRYYNYLHATTTGHSNTKIAKSIRKAIYEVKKQTGALDLPKTDHIAYGLGKNTQFLKILERSMKKWRNIKLWRAMKLNETPLLFDCSYNETMSKQEIRDLTRQIIRSFGENRLVRTPFVIQLCNMSPDSFLWHELSQQIPNFEQLPWHISTKDIKDVAPIEKIVYLSPDSPNVLENFNSDDIYVFGCIVDKGNKQPLTISKSKRLGIRSARLPLDKHIQFQSHQTLTLDQMMRIMLELRRTEDWRKAFEFIPNRKIIGYKNHPLPDNENSTNQRPKLGLRRQNLPPYPHIDCVRDMKVENYLPTSFNVVKHGDHEFLETFDGYVCMFVSGYHHPRQLDARSGYSVFFGLNHPLNLQGSVERRQATNHAKLYGFLKGMEKIPMDSFKKVCIMTDELTMISFIDRGLRNMSENSFRSTFSGKLNKDLETSMEVNKVLRMREDLTLRLMFCPNGMEVDGMYHASKIAQKAAEKATLDARIERVK